LNPLDFDEIHEMLFRLGIASVLGGVLGIDRDLHRKPAGVRVLALVCMGAAAISMVSVVAITGTDKPPGDGVLRTIQGVLSGIGFLGAGVIMRAQGKDEVHGITTAASIWVAAILGMICGLGQWMLGLCAFGSAWTILVGGRWLEFQILKISPPPFQPTVDGKIENGNVNK
jgi:putative Mg2+ transporter-C (MgtC) family protein